MKLSVVITHYKENEARCKDSLQSIDMQQNVDWSEVETLIVSDGPESEPLSEEFLGQFKNCQPKHLVKPTNTGPGDARNYGLDNTEGDYVWFMDIEDLLHNHYVFSLFLQDAYPMGSDCFVFNRLNPLKIQGKWLYAQGHAFPSWVHGMFFRRKFLDLHDIRFNEFKVWNEEHWVTQRLARLTDKISQVDYMAYVWKHDDETATSITTANGQSYSYRILPSWLFQFYQLTDYLYRNNKLKDEEPLTTLYQVYYMIHNFEWANPKSYPYMMQAQRIAHAFYDEFEHVIQRVPETAYADINKQTAQSSNRIPPVDFKTWMEQCAQTEPLTLADILAQPSVLEL